MVGIPTGAVVALKRLDLAKSRLDDTAPALRERLALAMLLDTCAALTAVVDTTIVVTPVPGLKGPLARRGVSVVADPGNGLNGAYAAGAAALEESGVRRVMAAVADLPALTASDVGAVLDAAAEGPGRAFVADHTGLGTTLLVAHDVPLDPLFEHGSAQRHAQSGATALALDAPRARLDVDRLGDLAAAAELGLGPATSTLWDGDRPVILDTGVIAASEPDGWSVVCADGVRRQIPRRAMSPELTGLHPTQRVHLARARDSIRLAWV
ncbi:2-phospho-L-lactate guanylyltransferase [Mariniluteicoccus flavus]